MSMPGAGMCRPRRYSASMHSVNRILFRSSGIRNAIQRLRSGTARFLLDPRVDFDTAGGRTISGSWAGCPWRADDRSPHGFGRISTVPPAAVIAASAVLENAVGLDGRPCRDSSPRPRIFTRAPLRIEALGEQRLGRDLGQTGLGDGVEVDGLVLDRNGLLKPRSFGTRMLRGIWPPSNPSRTRVARPSGPWYRGRRSCRPCRRYRDRRACALVRARRAAGDHGACHQDSSMIPASSTVTRWGTRRACRGSRDGRAGCSDLPIRPSPARAACRAAAWAWCRSPNVIWVT